MRAAWRHAGTRFVGGTALALAATGAFMLARAVHLA